MYDEPTAGLDPVASTVVEDLVRSLTVHGDGEENLEAEPDIVAEAGGIAAYIVVTHQHSTIRRSVDRLIFLHEVALPSIGLLATVTRFLVIVSWKSQALCWYLVKIATRFATSVIAGWIIQQHANLSCLQR